MEKNFLLDLEMYINKNFKPIKRMNNKDIVFPNKSKLATLRRNQGRYIEPIEMDHIKLHFDLANKSINIPFLESLEDILKSRNIDKNVFFEKYNMFENINKDMIILVCFDLNLDIDLCLYLFDKASLSLNNSLKKDIVVRYFIENKIYDIDLLNKSLEYFKLPLVKA